MDLSGDSIGIILAFLSHVHMHTTTFILVYVWYIQW